MWRSIVVGTDGSQTAARAVTVAAALAGESGGRLHLVNGYRPPGPPDLDHDDPTAAVWRQASEALLDEVRAEQVPAGLAVECHSVAASPAEAVVEVARQVGADLIVVGNRGLHGGRRPGGPDPVPELVARSAPCHVLIAKTT